MKKAVFSAVALAMLAGAANAQVKWLKWDGVVAIPDGNATTLVPGQASVFIDVPNGGLIEDLNVDVIVAHTWQGDLRLVLTGPGGQSVTLMDRPGTTASFGSPFGFSNDNLGNPTTGAKFIFDDSAALVYDTGYPGAGTAGITNISGAHRPENPLSVFNGLNKQGRWTLTVFDNAGGDTGSIRNFGLSFTVPAPGAVALFGAAGLAAARRRR